MSRATIVADLGFGDVGKGSIVDYLARTRPVTTIVRFNGGGQAAHNVVTPEGDHHTFSQFGSGTFVPGVRTHLSRFHLLDLGTLLAEAEHLVGLGCADALARLTVDGDAMVVTPFQKAANRLREILRAEGRHGSCGMGIGETMADSIVFPDITVHARDLRDPTVLVTKLTAIHRLKRDEFREHFSTLEKYPDVTEELRLLVQDEMPQMMTEFLWKHAMEIKIVRGSYLSRAARQGELLFEGAQGVLIDEWHGFHPYTTWSTATFDNALALLSEIDYQGEVERLGVTRSYLTRHGPGPFPTEDRRLSLILADEHNELNRWQGEFRVGWLDIPLLRYALTACGGADALVVTNLDRTEHRSMKYCHGYLVPGDVLRGNEDVVEENEDGLVIGFRRKKLITDLLYQEKLTRILNGVKPVYRDVPPGECSYRDILERELGLAVTVESHGPTWLGKRLVEQKSFMVA